ncbi:MAG: hypothetical protein Q9225_007687 [Loekoesia sp. 1 TL-2023]
MTKISTTLQVLHVADDPSSPATIYRLSEDDGRIIYVSIDPDVYDEDDYCSPSVLIPKLPPLPPGNWNKGHIIRREENSEPHFAWTRHINLPGITSIWHETFFEYNSLDLSGNLMPNVSTAFHLELGEVIAKFARFEWEIGAYQAETEAYQWIDGHGIGPKFLGHLTEDGRVIGFLLQRVDGHYAGIEDLTRCEEVVRKLHSLGVMHGDLNRYNFIVTEDQVMLIDFETSTKSHDEGEMAAELVGLREKLTDTSERDV